MLITAGSDSISHPPPHPQLSYQYNEFLSVSDLQIKAPKGLGNQGGLWHHDIVFNTLYCYSKTPTDWASLGKVIGPVNRGAR